MTARTAATQHEYLLDDDTTLMSTTDLKSIITHANDAFVKVSGYELHELTGQPHNLVRHPDMPKAAFADMWFTLQKGEPWTGIVKNQRKNGDHYWVRANVIPVVRNGKTTGYMSIRTKAKPEEIAAVQPLYKALKEGRCQRRLFKGLVIGKTWLGKIPALPLRGRIRLIMSGVFLLMMAASVSLGLGALPVLISALASVLGCLLLEWQIAHPL
ncbi:PAS domain-containing protein, partial [Buttiauxella agrestis]